jgi:phosphotransferase system enzyme I (PtsP)
MPWRTSAPRVLLRQLREIMARPESGQARPEDTQGRLDRIVKLIAANMVAEVCSIYVRHPDGSLELFATQGLKKEAVHNTRLKRGEGIVGLIARRAEPVNLPDARSHSAYSYRPETGEELFRSLLGVPILRAGQTLGVLTVQNAIYRKYTEDEVEALQTTAMVLAEMVASGALSGIGAEGEPDPRRNQAQHLSGLPLSDGIALGHVVLHEPRVRITKLFSEDTHEELARLHASVRRLREEIDNMLSHGEMARAGEHREVLEAYRMFAHDQGWIKRLEEAITAGLTAEAAVERVQNDTRAKLLRQTDPFWRERLQDLDDLANRLLRILTGHTETAASGDLPGDAIVFARNMGAAELLDYNRTKIRGLVIEEGGPSSHVAIVARAMGIPAVGQAQDVLDYVEAGDSAVLDAETGALHLRPSIEVVRAYADKVRFRAKRQAQYARLRDRLPLTCDGQRIYINMNAGLLVDLPHLDESGADGIGLFRTELQFMIASTFPRLEEQTTTYRQILERANGKPVVFRSLDVGGDKILPYLRQQQEENPALGWRAIRMALDRPGLFRTQLRALLRAAAGRELRVMFPFITEVREFAIAKAMVEKERMRLRRHGAEEPQRIALGAMIEVPSILWQLDELLPLVDFISVGSNDLLQFLFAADRGNVRVADRFDALSPAPLRVLRQVVLEAQKHNVPTTLCGELSGRPLEAMALIGLGYRSISMAPASIGPVKTMILSLDVGRLEAFLLQLIGSGADNIRERLKDYAVNQGVNLGIQ